MRETGGAGFGGAGDVVAAQQAMTMSAYSRCERRGLARLAPPPPGDPRRRARGRDARGRHRRPGVAASGAARPAGHGADRPAPFRLPWRPPAASALFRARLPAQRSARLAGQAARPARAVHGRRRRRRNRRELLHAQARQGRVRDAGGPALRRALRLRSGRHGRRALARPRAEGVRRRAEPGARASVRGRPHRAARGRPKWRAPYGKGATRGGRCSARGRRLVWPLCW